MVAYYAGLGYKARMSLVVSMLQDLWNSRDQHLRTVVRSETHSMK